MGSTLKEEEKDVITSILAKNSYLFAWTTTNMPSINPRIISHKFLVCKEAKLIAQKKRNMGEEKRMIVEQEVHNLLNVRFIQEIHHTTWLTNIVLVQKNNGKWQMCTDYTYLNKACLKDAYPIPSIDWLVDGVVDHKVLSFLDAYFRYNQILLNPADQEKTSFLTERANFCYEVRPIRLKNAGETYQRLMNRMFREQIGKTVEVYVDEMIVKFNSTKQHAADLAKIFGQLRWHDMRLNFWASC